jgi:hypothetical protein
VDEALEAYEAAIRAQPTEPDAYILAAELNLSVGRVRRGTELFRLVCLVENVPGPTRIYATNRLRDVEDRESRK